MKCTCKDWLPNVELIDGLIDVQSHMVWGNPKGYTGKRFNFCPWCGKKLISEKTNDGNHKAIPR